MYADLLMHSVHLLPALHQHASALAHTDDIPVPNPPAVQLPGKAGQKMDTGIGWGKTILGYAGVAGCLLAAGGMMLGIRGRSEMAKNHMTHLGWILGGSIVASSFGYFL